MCTCKECILNDRAAIWDNLVDTLEQVSAELTHQIPAICDFKMVGSLQWAQLHWNYLHCIGVSWCYAYLELCVGSMHMQ